MLVLSRKVGQKLVIDDNVTIVVNRVAGNRVQLGIEAPRDVHIMRGELDKIRRQFSESDQARATQPVAAAVIDELASKPELNARSAH